MRASSIKSFITPSILVLIAAATPARAQDTPALEQLSAHNVVWDSPSRDMHGSMPIGNGDLAANFWVEPSGDLVFYLSKSDSWDANQELLKLGRVRIRLDKPFVRDGRPFRQELDLARGFIVVESGAGEDKTTVDFWIDANRPVVNVQIKGAEAFTAQVTLEHWPKETYGNRPTQNTDIAKINTAAASGALRGDTILPAEDNTIRWYYRNTTSIFAETLKKQHLGHAVEKFHDPLLNLTFGGLIAGEGLVSKDDKTLTTAAPVKSLDIRIHALTAQTPEAAAWVSQLGTHRAANDRVAATEARPAHEQWWRDFWTRSWIFPEGTEEAKAVGRAYALQRWIQAGAGRGAYPIKFNGSLFTVDGMDFNKKSGEWSDTSPDWRKWGGCYWFQNTRLPYWSMLYSGDYDQMEPLWKMYREAVPLLKERTKTYFNHDGIFCSETMHPWGLNKQGDFGYDNAGFYPTNAYIRLYWDSGLELSQMMLDRYAHAPSEKFAKTTMVPIADEVVTFYEQHYPKPEPGKARFTPSMSLETWHVAVDPLPVVVGLRTVLTRLLELPESLSTPEQRKRWTRFLTELPETPVAEENGKKWILPARTFSVKKNSENPELYAVFPYRTYGLGKPDLDTALETWNRRLVKATGGWRQDSIQAALLGLTDEAKGYVVKNATNPSPIGPKPRKPSRFPAFWGPNFDSTPDQDHGSVTLIALQRMLMQCDGDTIRLAPAWPKDWNASFKLHAPKNTTVEGRVENGKVTDLKVTPESRRKDVIVGAILENGEFKTDAPDARPAFVGSDALNVPVDGTPLVGNPITTPPTTDLGSPGHAISKPNVIIILADDLGYGDVKCYNPERGKIPTPNIDKLASQGMRFTDAHTSSGVCSPSRYALLTGRYHWRSRLQSYVVNYLQGPIIAPGRLTLASLLKQHGYRTGAIGKWHLGWDFQLTADERKRLQSYGGKMGAVGKVKTAVTDEDLAAWRTIYARQFRGGPVTCGFDSYFGTDVPNWPPYCFIENDRTVGIPSELLAADTLRNNQADVQGPALAGWKLEDVLPALEERACAFIQNAAKAPEPFFLYLPLTAPHTPIATTKEWRGKSGLNDYADFVMQTDATIGRVLQALEESGAAQNTLVVFTSDNGFAPYVGAAELEEKGHFPSGPLRGYKGDAWEGGHRVPFIVRWPGKVKPDTRCDALVSQADLMATLAETLNAKLPDNAGEDSFSLMPLLQGGNKPVREYAISHAMNGLPALRKGSWKIIFGQKGGGFTNAPGTAATGQLYDLATDLGETKNLWQEQPELVAELTATMTRLVADGRSTPGEQQQNDVPVRWQRFLERSSPAK